MKVKYRFQRMRRLLWPHRYDRASYLLIKAAGSWWLFLTGWKREYKMAGLMIDLAHPRLKLALEADGERWHIDVVREMQRDEVLAIKGYQVKHYRYPILKNQPKQVKREVRRWFYRELIISFFK
jgi:very-short-patch-repair endonuclease